MKKSVERFIEEHTHVNYCEAVINQNGLIKYAKPSHVEVLIKASGKTKEEIYNLMNITDSPLEWLINYTKYVCVWNKGYMLPKTGITKLQKLALEKLVEANLIENTNFDADDKSLRVVRESLFASEYQIQLILNLFEISCERTTCKECNLVDIKGTQNECRVRFLYNNILKKS